MTMSVLDEPRAQLILLRTTPLIYTDVRTTDARTALTRALSQYLESNLSMALEGREIRVKKVFDSWPGTDVQMVLPALAVVSDQPGEYDTTNLTPSSLYPTQLPQTLGLPKPKNDRWLIYTSELDIELTVELWASDNTERMGLMMSLEDIATPVAWMYGFRLICPFYYGAFAEFCMTNAVYMDDASTVQMRYRRIQASFTGSIPVLKMVQGPGAKPYARLGVSDAPEDALDAIPIHEGR